MSVKKRKICVVVASRANYGRIKSVMGAIRQHEDLELQVVASASALLFRFGKVVEIMESDGFPPDAMVHLVIEGDPPVTMAKSTGLAIIEMASVFERLNPDIVVTVADRYETMATAIAATYMNIPVAHTQGGELTGSIDESVRHSVTKMAHIHMVTTEESRQRVIRMGEHPDRVHLTGCPSIDAISDIDLTLDPSVFSFMGGVGAQIDPKKPFLLVLQHPVTTEYEQTQQHISATIEAMTRLAIPTVWLWPNVDAGTDIISKSLRRLRETINPSWLHLHRNFKVEDYARVMNACACIVGNSSSSLREGAFLGTPAVNIGNRQMQRERGANVIDVPPDAAAIEAAIRRQIAHGRYPSDPLFGDGKASQRIANVLATVPLNTTQKSFFDAVQSADIPPARAVAV